MRTLWTIPVEIQFYVLFIAVWALVAAGRPRLPLLLPLIGLGAAAVVIWKLHTLSADSLPFWGSSFLIGAAAGLLWRRHAGALAR